MADEIEARAVTSSGWTEVAEFVGLVVPSFDGLV